ncbi:retrovirus-related pol polyprotein from transposon TNT 1-94 [Tanacetum coccineum]
MYCASNNVENKTKRKRHKRTSSKQNDKQVNHDVLSANRDFVHFSDLDTLSSVRRPKHNSVIWKKKGWSNTSSADLSSVSNSKLNNNVKRYSRKHLLSCNNSHHVDTKCAYVCNDAMNVSCKSRLHASYYVNDLFVFDDVSIRNSRVSKMLFRKKPHDSLNFLGTVHFGNNDFVVIAGYGDVVIGSMMIKKVYYVEDGVDLLTGDRSSNLYTIALNEIALNFSACLLAKASSLQSCLWHQHLSHLNFATINNLVKSNLVRGLPKMKFEKDHLCSACEQGKIHRKHHKSKMDFASNKP